MTSRSPRTTVRRVARAGLACILPMLMLGACSTRFVSSEALDTTEPDTFNQDAVVDSEPGVWWAHQYALPVEVHGTMPGRSTSQLASLSRREPPASVQGKPVPPSIIDHTGRILMYVRPAHLPEDDALCEEPHHVGQTGKAGRDADVTVALCDDSKTLAVVHGVVTADASDQEIKSGLDTMQSALFWDLYKTPVMP